MAKPEPTNPYQPPESHDVPMPTSPMTAGAVAVSLMFGCTVFLTTCLGGGFVAVEYAYGESYLNVLLLAIWIGSPVIAIVGTVWYGRRVQRKAQEKSLRTQVQTGERE